MNDEELIKEAEKVMDKLDKARMKLKVLFNLV